MLNRVVLAGRLTKDPQLRYTPNGIAVANFNLAVNRPFTNQNGEREADFLRVIVWRKQAENTAEYLKQGSMVGIDGRLQSRRYQNREGKTVFMTEVVAESVQFLEPKGKNGSGNTQKDSPNTQNESDDPFAGETKPADISEEDLPF